MNEEKIKQFRYITNNNNKHFNNINNQALYSSTKVGVFLENKVSFKQLKNKKKQFYSLIYVCLKATQQKKITNFIYIYFFDTDDGSMIRKIKKATI